VDRLEEDHANAQILANAIAGTPGLALYPAEIETNLVYMEVDPDLGTAQQLVRALKEQGVWTSASSPRRVRLVTHLDISRPQVERAADTIRKVARRLAPVPA
jgi:threonine aldolase